MATKEESSTSMFRLCPNVPEGFIDYLRQGLEEERDCIVDFIIKVDNVEIPCNTVVLRTQSHYFRRLFQHKEFTEVVEGCVELKYLSPTAVQRVVDYMYSATIEFDSADVGEVLEVLDLIQITDDRLLAHITNYMIDNMNSANCLEWLCCAEMYNLPKLCDLKQRVHDTMKTYFTEVTEGKDFLDLSYDQLSELFTQLMKEHDAPQDKAFVAAARWVMHETPLSRISHSDEIAQIIKKYRPTYSEVAAPTFCRKYKDYLKEHLVRIKRHAELQVESQSVGSMVFIIGGSLEKILNNRKTWLVNLDTGESVEKASVPHDQRIGTICNTPMGTIVAGGGTNAFFLYETDSWTELAPMPAYANGAGSVCVNGKKVYFCGSLAASQRDSVYCLDLAGGTWKTCPDMLEGERFPTVGCVNQCVFVVGFQNRLQCFDTESNLWSFRAPLPSSTPSVCYASAVTLAGRLYVVGGRDGICVRYDPILDSWTALAKPLNAHLDGSAAIVNTKILLSGGRCKDANNSQYHTDTIEEYDPVTNTWTLLTVRLPKPLINHAMILT